MIRFQATHDLCLDSILRMPSIAPWLLALPTRMTSWAKPSRELRLGHAGTYSSCRARWIMVMLCHVWRLVEQRLLETNYRVIGCWVVRYFMNCVRHATGTDLLNHHFGIAILPRRLTPGTSRRRESPARCAWKHGLPCLKFLLDGVGNLLDHRSSQRPGS